MITSRVCKKRHVNIKDDDIDFSSPKKSLGFHNSNILKTNIDHLFTFLSFISLE